jgi:transposase
LVKPTVVVLDNASIHRSKLFLSRIADWYRKNRLIQFIPPYCP